jgi:hypothetical protein
MPEQVLVGSIKILAAEKQAGIGMPRYARGICNGRPLIGLVGGIEHHLRTI